MRGALANGREFLKARTSQGFTQEQLAALAQVDVKTVRKAERGKQLDLGTLTRLAYALQTDLRVLLVDSSRASDIQVRRRDVVMHWQRAWDEQNHEAVLALYREDAVLRLPGGSGIPFSGTFHGKAEIRQANETAWSTCRTEPGRIDNFYLVASEDTVILKGVKGIRLPSGEVAPLGCIHIFSFAGDRIREHYVEYDTLEFARLLQLPPFQASPETSR